MATTPLPTGTIELKLAAANDAMGWLDWSSSLVHSLAWPVAAVLIAMVFRTQLRGLLGKIRRLSWGDKTVHFSDKLDELEDTAHQEPATRTAEAEPRRDAGDVRFESLLAIFPEAAILDAWRPIEMLMEELDDGPDVSSHRRRRSLNQRLEVLVEHKVITPGMASLARELQTLRNAAAHHNNLTTADAYRFKALSDQLLDMMEHYLRYKTDIEGGPVAGP